MSKTPNFDNMREKYNISEDTEEVDTSSNVLVKKERDINIMEAMISYNKNENDVLSKQLTTELEHQNKLNHILKTTSYSDNLPIINEFVSKNKDIVHNQIENLEDVYGKLKDVVHENHELKDEQSDYEQFNDSNDAKQVINDINKLKSLKSDILLFLKETGMHTY